MRKSFSARTTLVATALAVGSLIAGCSSSGHAGSAATGGSTGTGSSPAGSIKLMVIGELSSPVMSMPELVVGAQAAINEVNAAGGVNGRKIVLLQCNSQTDPNVAASCARKAVSEKVSAVVGMLSFESDSIIPILEAAKIPSIGSSAFSKVDTNSPVSFPINSSPVALMGTAITMPGYQQCTHPAFLTINNPAAQDGGKRVQAMYAKLGVHVKIVEVDSLATDIRPQVATLLSGGTDCVFPAVTPTIAIGLMKAIADSGQQVKVSQTVVATPLDLLRKISSAARGMYSSSPFLQPGTSAAGDKFAAAMNAVDPKALKDDSAAQAYVAVHLFAQASASLTDFSGANVLQAMNSARNLDAGLIAPIPSWPADSGLPGLSRIEVTREYSYVFDGQNLKLASPDPIDIKPALVQASSGK